MTASVDGIELRHPIRVGEKVTMTAVVGYTSERSMGVSVSMTHGRPEDAQRKTLAGYMTFVALDPSGNALPVPQLQPETPEERARFREGRIRREFASGSWPASSPRSGISRPTRRRRGWRGRRRRC